MKRLKFTLLPVLLIVAIFISFIPLPVYAATQDRAIQGEGSATDGSYVGGAADYTNLNSDDSGTSILRMSGSGAWYHCYDMQNFATSVSKINSVTLYTKAASNIDSGASLANYVRISGSNYYGTTSSVFAAWNTYSTTWTTNPATGLEWTTATINAAEFGFRGGTGAATVCDITYMYILIDYNAATVPTVTTSAASGIIYDGQHKATMNGVVTDDGGLTIDYYGFVWDTSDKGDPGNNDPSTPPGTWSNGWKSGAGDYGENSFSYQITGLIISTTYYYRAAAHNSLGWSYGSAISFRTLGNPSITTLAATSVVSTTARVNASVTDDGKEGGGENCTVVFVYVANAGAHYANYAAILGAGGTEVTATGTYNTGGLPYYDLSGLAVSTNYDFSVKITNSVSTQYGGVLYFVTESGVFTPTNFVAIPTGNSISLLWVKGVGASNTFIRYDTSSYPTAIGGGLGTVYAGTGSSYLFENLTSGQTYYFSAWGLTSGVYSGTYATAMGTCLAESPSTVPNLPAPSTPSSWSLTPSVTSISNLPFFSFVNYFADDFLIPQATIWYGLFIVFSVTAGLFTYWRGNQNLLAAMGVCLLGLIIGSILGLVYLWIAVFFLLAGIAMSLFAHRWP